MTDIQKYDAVLKALGEALAKKDNDIICQKWQIEELKEKLSKAEQERAEIGRLWNETAGQLEDALEEIALLKGGAA